MRKKEFNTINGLSRLTMPTITQEIDPKVKQIKAIKVTPNAIRKAPRMLAIVPIHAIILEVP